jgi:excisionase family DNA binding protein
MDTVSFIYIIFLTIVFVRLRLVWKSAMRHTRVPKLCYRPAAAAEAIDVSRAKMYALIASGVIPSIRVGKSLRVPVKGLAEWVERQQPK